MKTIMEEEKKRGGKREGAGRKKTCGKPILFKPDIEIEPLLLKQENRNKFINDCIKECVSIKKPEQ